jgi:lipopolysaccharide/colanic/teichoic acid biosynthesis glycosyltransferase
MLKRVFDVIASLLGLVVLFPFFIIAGIAIKLDSKGPVFYRGIRAGRHGVPFKIFKFRTMVMNAEKLGGGTTALGDVRITRVGSLLRKFKLDEFPQLINIVLGDMSLVGPRPELLQYTDLFQGEEKKILSVRPGITDYSSMEFVALEEIVGRVDVDRIFEEKILARKNPCEKKSSADQIRQ